MMKKNAGLENNKTEKIRNLARILRKQEQALKSISRDKGFQQRAMIDMSEKRGKTNGETAPRECFTWFNATTIAQLMFFWNLKLPKRQKLSKNNEKDIQKDKF
jgi:hypothetical protein